MRSILPSLALAIAAVPAAAQTARFRDPVFAAADVQRNVAYGSAVNRFSQLRETLYLDRYEPRGDTWASRPAVVVVHGGGFTGGDKGTPQFVTMCTELARLGYVAVSINYRLAPPNTPITQQVVTDAMEDFKAAVRWLRRNEKEWRIDPNRIASIGSSAGSYTALEAAYVPGEGQSGNPGHPSHHHAVVDLWGHLLDESQMQKGEPPVCIIHGTNDNTVPYRHALSLAARARTVGVPYELHPLEGAGHAPFNLLPQFWPHIVAFLWEHLKLGQLAGLAARPGYSSPGTLHLDRFGVASDVFVLHVSANRVSIDLGALGVFCLDPTTLVAVQSGIFVATPRLPASTVTFAVPAGLTGRSFHWQELHLTAALAPRLLTDCVTTAF